MNNLRYKLLRFMYGRNGVDALSKFLTYIYFALWLVNLFVRSSILSSVSLLLFVYIFFRIFSKNLYKRQSENMKYISIKSKFMSRFNLRKRKFAERKTHIYRKCPSCKAVIRLPRKKGKHICTCPKCRKDFKVRVL